MQLPPDTLLQGRYRVVALIAQGGMGAVYRAVDERLGHTVALKQTLVADPALRAAFEREARLLAGLHHPALPVVSDHFAEGGGQFLVMQYIPGDDLAALLKARGAPFPPDQALAWADDILDALEHLHGRQPPVVHRDIKPQNLKLAPHGGVVLLDFGLAKGLAGAGNSASPSLFGYTPQYAPIEQIQGAGTGPRSDLYSLAATLYELLAGAPPPDALARVAATLRGAPDPLRPLLEIDPGLPAHAAAALDQALALNQDLRPPSAAAMRAALGSVAPALAPPPRPGASEGAHARAAGPGPAATGPTIVAPPPGDRAATGPTIAQPRPRRLYPRTALMLAVAAASVALTILAVVLGGPRAAAPAAVPPVADAGTPPVADPAAPGGSFADPVPYGGEGAFGPLRLRVLATMRGREAWNAMYRANQFNDPPPAGSEYLLVQLALEAAADAPRLYPRLAGDRRVLYAPGGVTPAPLPEALPAGQRAEAWIAYLVAEGEQGPVLHVDSVGSGPDLPPLFMASAQGARLAPDPAVELVVPDARGVSHRAPAPLGATAVTEDYELTVLEALRGPAVLEALVARFDAVERPAAGHEYALVRLRVRYLGDGGAVGWASLGPSDFAAVRAGAADPAAEAIEHPPVYILPDDTPALDANLLPGGQVEGWTVLELPAGAADVALVFSPGFDPNGLNTRYFALE